MFHDGDARVHCYRCEEGLHIIGWNALPLLWLDGLDVCHKMPGVPDVGVMTYQWCENVSCLLGHSMHDCTCAGFNGFKGVSCLCILGRP